MPENTALPDLAPVALRFGHKMPDVLIFCRGEEKGLVKFPRTGQLRVTWPQSQVLCDFASAHMVEPCNTHPALTGSLVQSCTNFRIRAPERNAKVSPRSPGFRDTKVEVAVGQKNSSPAFGNKGMNVFELAPQGLHLSACARAEQNQGDAPPIQFNQRRLGCGKRTVGRIDQSPLDAREDQ